MREPGGLPSMGSHRVGHDWSDVAAAAAVCFLCLWVCFCFVTYVHLCYFLFHIICETWILIQHQVESQYRDPVETESFRYFLLYFDEEVLNYTKGIAFLRPSLEKVFQIATWSALKSCLTPVWKVPPPKELFSTNCRVLLCYEASGDEFFSFGRFSVRGQRRWWHPTPVLLPGKSHRCRSLVGCSPWGH